MGIDTEETKISMSAIGEKLRQARERKAITIDQVWKQTHIHSTVLTALEEGKCDEMLNPTYVKGFLRSYSGYLGLDSTAILKEYAQIHKDTPRPPINIPSPEPKEGSGITAYIFRNIKTKVIIILVLLAVIFVVHKVFFRGDKRRPAAHSARQAAKTLPLKKQPLAARGVSRNAASGNLQNFPKVSIPKNVPLTVVLKVKRSVMIQVKEDGIVLFKRLLPKGSSEVFTADDVINIYVGHAESVDLTLNGTFLGSPGRGLIRNLEITRQGIRAR